MCDLGSPKTFVGPEQGFRRTSTSISYSGPEGAPAPRAPVLLDNFPRKPPATVTRSPYVSLGALTRPGQVLP